MAPSNNSFVELVSKTNYSFLQGASHPEEMVEQASQLGYAGIGITDTLGVYGAPRAHLAAREKDLLLIIGAEVPFKGGSSLWLLAKNRNGYGNLCELLTQAHQDRQNPEASWETLWEKASDLFCLLPASTPPEAELSPLRDAFGTNLAFLVSRFLDGTDSARVEAAEAACDRWKIPCVASNQPLFHLPQRKPLHDVLSCIHHGCPLTQAGRRLLPNAERYLKPLPHLQALFKDHPEWLSHTLTIASECRFSLDEIRYHYPTEWIPAGQTSMGYLRQLVWEGATRRYHSPLPSKVENLLNHEMQLIEELQYSDYFLTIYDIVCFAKSQGILCQGRGSAANSVVCYVLGITAIDPAHMDLLFERFISRERREPPDIDIDFEHERREEVIQYIYRRYGRHRAAITAEVICFRRKSALREVAKVFEVPESTLQNLQVLTHRRDIKEILPEEIKATAPEIPIDKLFRYYEMVQSILGFPRHLGTHVGGFVLCQDALCRNVPIESAAMPGRTIVQWDKNDLDALGFVRVDVLGLGILTAIRKTLHSIEKIHGKSLTLATIPREDPKVYDPLCRADTVGVFQIESRAQMNMLPRLQPRCFYDLVVEVSLVRPGPIQGDMVHPYLKRRAGEEPIQYAHPALETILKKTYGVPLFQEQIMKMAMLVAGFSAGQADELRRAMGSWRRDGRLSLLGDRFRQGLIQNGVSEAYAQKIFQQIEGFAEYGFPESHAASFAVLVYATAYLKHYYPAAFLTGLLNAQPMGFYSSHSLIHDGIRHGVRVHSIDIQRSYWDNDLGGCSEIRLGFRQIQGLRLSVGQAIEKARPAQGFPSWEFFLEHLAQALKPTPLTKRDLFLLAGANAFECFGLSRRDAFWQIQSLGLQDSLLVAPPTEVSLPPESRWETICLDYESQGVCLHTHPMQYFRASLKSNGVLCSQELRQKAENTRASVAGIVICRQQPPTASGVLFITLEDEYGFINLVIWKKTFEAFRTSLLTQSFLACTGRVQKARASSVVHVIVDDVKPLDLHTPLHSRDFR